MITRLVEAGERRKADQYWPDKSGKLEVGGNCWVEHLSTYYQGSYYLRLIELPGLHYNFIQPSIGLVSKK